MKFLILAAIVGALVVISGLIGSHRRKKTISGGNKQVSGNHVAINPVDKSYSAIRNFMGAQ